MAISRFVVGRSVPKKKAAGGRFRALKRVSRGKAATLPDMDLDGAYEWTMKRYPKTMKRLAE